MEIRKILLTEHIGSILIALLVCEGIVHLVSTLVREILYLYSSQHPEYSAIDVALNRWISTLVTTAIYFSVAYFLARWIYPTVGQKGGGLSSDGQESIQGEMTSSSESGSEG